MKQTRKKDLREYSDRELSFQVFNSVDLYGFRHGDNFISQCIEPRFEYSMDQLIVLLRDLASDLLEIKAEKMNLSRGGVQ